MDIHDNLCSKQSAINIELFVYSCSVHQITVYLNQELE